MEHTNFIVRIPEPCHEDWNKMQPDEKGKFCSSCSKSVFDFSNKSDIEIKSILLEHKDQKVCGHFNKTQINRPLNFTIDFNNLPKNISTTKAFAIALFLVFGTLLFSCTDEKDRKVGEIEIVNQDPKKIPEVLGMIAPPPTKEKIDFVLTVPNIETVEGEIAYREELHVAGGIGYYEEPIKKDSILPTKDSVIIKSIPDVEERMMGIMVVNHIPEDTTTTVTDSLIQKNTIKVEETVFTKQTGLSIYPNPSKGEFTIKYDVQKRADVKIEIFDIKGTLLKSVVNTPNQYEGKYQIPVNFNEFSSGIYIVTLINGEKRFSEKVVIEK